jgi:hypothetical protein
MKTILVSALCLMSLSACDGDEVTAIIQYDSIGKVSHCWISNGASYFQDGGLAWDDHNLYVSPPVAGVDASNMAILAKRVKSFGVTDLSTCANIDELE